MQYGMERIGSVIGVIMINEIVMYGELIMFGLVAFVREVYHPWMSLVLVIVLTLIVLLIVHSVLMGIFNKSIRWYHKALYWLPVIKTIGIDRFRHGHKIGAVWGLEEGYKLLGNPKKLKRRKILKALEMAGI